MAAFMKNGNAELAIASSLGKTWDRLDTWPLFTEAFVLTVSRKHRVAGRHSVHLSDLCSEPLLIRTYSEDIDSEMPLLRSQNFSLDRTHEVPSEHDLELFLEQGLGVAFVPRSALFSDCIKRISITGLDIQRTVSLYGVAGRQRTAVANMIMKMLRASDWSRYAT